MGDTVDAFHAAIYDDPTNPLPRLVYADWLDDQGEAEYAELIRLWHEIDARSHPQPKPLRDRRHQLVRPLYERWDGAALGFGLGDLFLRGVLRDEVRLDARSLLTGWRHWPVYLRPRSLDLRDYVGVEVQVLAIPLVTRATLLRFAGVGELMREPPYPADSDPLLAALAGTKGLDHLQSLTLNCIRPSRTGLCAFATSAIAGRLASFGMSYALSYEMWDDYRVEADQPPAGAVAEAIGEFLNEFAGQLPP